MFKDTEITNKTTRISSNTKTTADVGQASTCRPIFARIGTHLEIPEKINRDEEI